MFVAFVRNFSLDIALIILTNFGSGFQHRKIIFYTTYTSLSEFLVQIIIEGVRGSGYEGDIAIDAIELRSHNCCK